MWRGNREGWQREARGVSQGPWERREASPRLLHQTAQFLLHSWIMKSLSRVWFFVIPWTVAYQAPFGLSQFVMSLCNLPVNQYDQAAAYQGRVEEQAAPWEGIVLTLALFRTAGEWRVVLCFHFLLDFSSSSDNVPLQCLRRLLLPTTLLFRHRRDSVSENQIGRGLEMFLKDYVPLVFPTLIQISSCKESRKNSQGAWSFPSCQPVGRQGTSSACGKLSPRCQWVWAWVFGPSPAPAKYLPGGHIST